MSATGSTLLANGRQTGGSEELETRVEERSLEDFNCLLLEAGDVDADMVS